MPPSSSRIPPLLHPYVRLPPAGSLHLLTSVLGASTNWLVIRYLCSAFSGSNARNAPTSTDGHGSGLSGQDDDVAVILVSFLRDWEFWKAEGRRAGGLDLARLAQQNRFAFVDGLSNLFSPLDAEASGPAPAAPTAPASPSLPVRSGRTITPRNPPQSSQQQTPARSRPTSAVHASATQAPTFCLTAPMLSHLETVIQKAQTHLNSSSPKRILLLLDAPDFLLAAADSLYPAPAENAITPTNLASTLLALRGTVHAAVLSLAADTPLVAAAVDAISQHNPPTSISAASGHHTPLEAAHAAFLAGQGHVADWMLSLRLLDTGFAADVSGVLRITRGDNNDGDDEEDSSTVDATDALEEKGMDEKEVLYYIGGDGSVRVFERGSGGEGTG